MKGYQAPSRFGYWILGISSIGEQWFVGKCATCLLNGCHQNHHSPIVELICSDLSRFFILTPILVLFLECFVSAQDAEAFAARLQAVIGCDKALVQRKIHTLGSFERNTNLLRLNPPQTHGIYQYKLRPLVQDRILGEDFWDRGTNRHLPWKRVLETIFQSLDPLNI